LLDTANSLTLSNWVVDGFPEEVNIIADPIYADFNRTHETDFKFQLTKQVWKAVVIEDSG
jgi:hypothetical protein